MIRVTVPDTGLVIPKEWLGSFTQVDIEHHNGRVVILPVEEVDSLYELGQSPSDVPITDASVNHDKYLYGE